MPEWHSPRPARCRRTSAATARWACPAGAQPLPGSRAPPVAQNFAHSCERGGPAPSFRRTSQPGDASSGTAAEQVRATAPPAVRELRGAAHRDRCGVSPTATCTGAPEPDRAAAAAGQQGPGPRGLRAPAAARRDPQEHSAASVLVQLQGAPPAEASRLLNTGLDLLASRRFVALEFIGDDGHRLPVFGQLTEQPSLTPATARTSQPASP